MKVKKIAMLAMTLTNIYANAMPTASVLGRDLNAWGLGKIGHLGLANDDYAPSYISRLVMEALDESPSIVMGDINTFKIITRYWGSKSGLADMGQQNYNILLESNHQRWWKPEYTTSTHYDPGIGNLVTGKIIHHGYFRCDTYVAWCYYQGGGIEDLINVKTMLPFNVFNTFPTQNPDFIKTKKQDNIEAPFVDDIDQEFTRLTAEELNELDYVKFQTIADPDFKKTTPLHVLVEWSLARSSLLSDAKRLLFIDRLAMMSDNGTITRLIDMYKTENQDSEKIKNKLIIGITTAYQHQMEKNKNFPEKEILLEFYKSMINKPSLNSLQLERITDGLIDLSPPEEILKQKTLIDKNLAIIEEKNPLGGLGTRISLIHASPELEKIYLKKTLAHLRAAKSSDLDDMFFGTTAMGIRSFVDKNSIPLIKAYVEDSKEKYTGNNEDKKTLAKKDIHYGFARNEYQNLTKVL